MYGPEEFTGHIDDAVNVNGWETILLQTQKNSTRLNRFLYIVKVETEAKRQPKLNELGFKNIYELTL
jgi:hypothetical protein